MRYVALVTDYDGTLAAEGRVDDAVMAALARVRESGRQLVLITGRELDDLRRVFPRLDLFDRVVAENGALLYRPATQEEVQLAQPPEPVFVEQLRARGVEPLAQGRVIVATRVPQERVVLEVIRDLGLELQVIFNKGAVMVLPSGVNKATGLEAALRELGLSPHNAVGIGDAENDHAFLSLCECAVAVANALPMLKERADVVTRQPNGAGVIELAEALVADDLRTFAPRLARHELLLGQREDGQEVRLAPYGASILLAGASGSGKSTLATAFLERLGEHGYQFCIIDPEGDYQTFEGATVLGDSRGAPSIDEVLGLLDQPDHNVVVNLVGMRLEDRPAFFEALLPRLQQLRARTGRPHWIVIDEAHHLLPMDWHPAALTLPQEFINFVLITVHPDRVARAALEPVDTVIAVGPNPEEAIRAFGRHLEQPVPPIGRVALQTGEALAWSRHDGVIFRFRAVPSRAERRRHLRKYAEGDLGPHSFYFRGPDGKLNLRAQNLIIFNQIADGVDDATWLYHLRRGDYSRWFREAIKDDGLAAEAEQIERQPDLPPRESRARIRAAIEQRYTAPA